MMLEAHHERVDLVAVASFQVLIAESLVFFFRFWGPELAGFVRTAFE